MPIRLSIAVDTHPLDGLDAILASADRANVEIMDAVLAANGDRYLEPIHSFDPGPSQHDGQWSVDPAANERARRYYHWAASEGIIHADPVTHAYIRSGALQQQWQFVRRGHRLALENVANVAAFVYSMARNIRARGGRPNPGHIATNWPGGTRDVAVQTLNEIIRDIGFAWSQSVAASAAAGQYVIVAGSRKAVFA